MSDEVEKTEDEKHAELVAKIRAGILEDTVDADEETHEKVRESLKLVFQNKVPEGRAIFEDEAVSLLRQGVFRIIGDFDSLEDGTTIRFVRKMKDQDGKKPIVTIEF